MLSRLKSALERAVTHLINVQNPAGDWEGEVWWCPVPTAQVVFTYTIIGQPIPAEEGRLILHYFAITQRSDGGWGLHPESTSYRYVTTLVYVAARLLGAPADAPMLQRARAWMDINPGGIDGVPTHGKLWLAMLGLYDWQFVHTSGPEFFLIPRWVFFSPARIYYLTRSVYRSMAYLKSVRLKYDLGSLGDELRVELYGSAAKAADTHQRYTGRHTIASTDVFCMPNRGLRLTYDLLRLGEVLWKHIPGAEKVREKCRRDCLKGIRIEQRTSQFLGTSATSSLPNILAMWHANDVDPVMLRCVDTMSFWRWTDAVEGSRYAPARSTAWDTAFVLQALTGTPETAHLATPSLRAGYRRLLKMQVTEELAIVDREDRDVILGGWCFGEKRQGWAVSDCTAEAIIALLDCHRMPDLISAQERISEIHLKTAICFMLTRQNPDGGFGSFESRRGGRFLDNLNPTEIFGSCMNEASYVECSASALRALCACATDYPEIASDDVAVAIARTIQFLLKQQRADGTWVARWGINLIYATRFAVEALRAAQIPCSHPALSSAARWIKSIQRADGGWGEHFSGCHTDTYVPHLTSLVISTSWATLALIACEDQPSEALGRGITWLTGSQKIDGTWARDSVNGLFFLTAMMDYRLYNAYFPTIALAKAAVKYAR